MYQWLNNPKVYQTEHDISRTICGWVAHGFNYPLLNVSEYKSGDAVMYGILRGCFEVMEQIDKSETANWVNIDWGYFTDRVNKPYFRFTRDARTYEYALLDLPSDRFKEHNLTIRDYKTKGDIIIVLPPSEFWCAYYNINLNQWIEETIFEVRKYSDKIVKVKHKHETIPLSEWLKDASVLIHYSSMGGIDALLAGVPVITTGQSFLQKHTSTQISDINKPKLTDRELLFNNLAYNQFSPNEIYNGVAKSILNEIYKELDNG